MRRRKFRKGPGNKQGGLRSIFRAIRRASRERGDISENHMQEALNILQQMGMPIEFEFMEKWSRKDRIGIDVEVWGVRPFFLRHIALDCKSSDTGARVYEEKKKQKAESGKVSKAVPGYPVVRYTGEGGTSCSFLLRILKILFKESEHHQKEAGRLHALYPKTNKDLKIFIRGVFSKDENS